MNREILRLAIPNIVSNVTVPLLSTVDTALMGRLSEIHVGAVGVAAMIFNFIYWNFGFLRMGTTGLTAQAFGQGDPSQLIQILGRATLITMAVTVPILLLQYPIGELSFYLMGVSGEQKTLVAEYFYIRVWAAPAVLISYSFIGWFFGMQNAIIPLVLTIAVNALNIGLSFLFVYGLEMDVKGVALGTTIAQYFGVLLGSILFWWKYGDLLPHLSRAAILRWEALKQFLRLNFDIFLRTFLLTLAFTFFYSQSTSEGALILAANVILLQFGNWMSYGIDGFAFASESLVGKYKGAGDNERTYRAIRLSFAWGMGLAVGYSLAYGFFGHMLLRVFTNQADILQAAMPFVIWVALFPLLSTPCYVWDGIFIGLTASKAMRNSMILAFLIYLLAYWLLQDNYGNHGLWAALLVFMIGRGLIQQIYFWFKGIGLN